MSDLEFNTAAVIGASGPTGYFICEQLLRRGTQVRAAARNQEKLEGIFAEMEVDVRSTDALDPSSVRQTVQGCDLVVDCVGLPAEHMGDHPRTAENIVKAAHEVGARCLQVSSFWPYLPITNLPLDETHPRRGGPDYVQQRREAEDVMQAGGGAVVHLPDFYGPRVHTSTLQQALEEAFAGKTMNWLGARDTAREYVLVPDAAHMIVALAHRPEAYGERWIVPGAGPLTAEDVARLAGEILDREIELRSAGIWTLRLLSLLMKPLRQFMPMIPYYIEPISYDGAKLEALIGKHPSTSYAEGFKSTFEWMRRRCA